MDQPVDILILSNGPGELATWVQPVVKELRRQLGNDRSQIRISLVLAPCSNASGQEVAIAQRYPELDRIQAAAHFFPFLLTGKTVEPWDWRDRGVVLFLGGDQVFPIVIGKRLGYRIVIYAEWEARWHRWSDRFGVMQPEILKRVAPQYAHKFTVVGDLMAEAGNQKIILPSPHPLIPPSPLIGLLPGSKPMKLMLGVPLTLAIANHVQQQNPEIQFVIPVAPTLDLLTLAHYADPHHNPIIERLDWGSATLEQPEDQQALPYLVTPAGVKVYLWTGFPAYDLLTQCQLCLTTLGANTAELGALAVPMIVMVPTQQLDIMKAWDGIPGLLMNLPLVGGSFATLINWIASRNVGLLAWPNIWAQREIVPELIGRLEPEAIAAQVLHYLKNPELLDQMSQALRTVRGQPGAAEKLVQLVCEELMLSMQEGSRR
ncbi:MAG: lipid-A-disaccharide synthase [Leptolyngbyaceae cyanobacterium bins.302]|nr:lipid-A-disaccharide synthase [Leptolyngbyaceae cyanobacterium bins.302]